MGGVAAYKLEGDGAGKWRLNPAWLSRDMDMAEEVIVANGVVFAYGAGEDTTQVVPDLAWNEPGGPWFGGGLERVVRAAHSRTRGHATIYALDAQTGKELWSSGNQITSWNHFSGLTVANGRAYLATFDGMMYSFGVPQAATGSRQSSASCASAHSSLSIVARRRRYGRRRLGSGTRRYRPNG